MTCTPLEQAKKAQAAAQRQLELVTSALDAQEVSPEQREEHEAYCDAVLLARFMADQVSRLNANNPFTNVVAKSGADTPQPKMRPRKPSQPKQETFIPIGTVVYGRIKVGWTKGYSFVEVIGTIEDDGELVEVSGHTDVFLLKSRILDFDERESLNQGDTIAFVAAEGRDGKLSAESVRAASVEETEDVPADDVEAGSVSCDKVATEAEPAAEAQVNAMAEELAEWPATNDAAMEDSERDSGPANETACASEDA